MRNRLLDNGWEGENIELAVQFIGVSSDFYPDLAEWYDRDAELWREKAKVDPYSIFSHNGHGLETSLAG